MQLSMSPSRFHAESSTTPHAVRGLTLATLLRTFEAPLLADLLAVLPAQLPAPVAHPVRVTARTATATDRTHTAHVLSLDLVRVRDLPIDPEVLVADTVQDRTHTPQLVHDLHRQAEADEEVDWAKPTTTEIDVEVPAGEATKATDVAAALIAEIGIAVR